MGITDLEMQEGVRAEWDAYLDTIDLEKIPKHQFSRQFERNMKRMIQRMFPASGSHGWKRFVKAAVIVVVSLAVAFSGLMTVEAFRERVIHFFTQVFSTHTNVEISTEGYTDTKFVPIQFGYLPDGMEQTDIQKIDTAIKEILENSSNFIILTQRKLMDNYYIKIGIDTEDADIKNVIVNDLKISLIYKDNSYHAVWVEKNYIITLYSDLPEKEIIKIIENIKVE